MNSTRFSHIKNPSFLNLVCIYSDGVRRNDRFSGVRDERHLISEEEKKELLEKILNHQMKVASRVHLLTQSGMRNPIINIIGGETMEDRRQLFSAIFTSRKDFNVHMLSKLASSYSLFERHHFPERAAIDEEWGNLKGGFYGLDTCFGLWVKKLHPKQVVKLASSLIEGVPLGKGSYAPDLIANLQGRIWSAIKILNSKFFFGYEELWGPIGVLEDLCRASAYGLTELNMYNRAVSILKVISRIANRYESKKLIPNHTRPKFQWLPHLYVNATMRV